MPCPGSTGRVILPFSIGHKPQRMRRIDDLPEPLGPIIICRQAEIFGGNRSALASFAAYQILLGFEFERQALEQQLVIRRGAPHILHAHAVTVEIAICSSCHSRGRGDLAANHD